MNQQEARQKIQQLIDKYEAAKKAGQIKSYTEEDTKNGFIQPLFEALGWSVSDRNEVTAEEQISGDRVDYGFYLNGRIKFYLEAKPFRADIHKEEYAQQAIRYSWNKGTTWAILTDFESLIVFNALSPEKSLHGKRYFEIPYTEYLSRFEQLWQLSKESFATDLIDTEAQKVGKKIQKIFVGDQLYKDLTECRRQLTRAFSVCNKDKNLDQHLIDEGVQRLLDRLIFIRVAEDRKIEPPTLRPLINEWKASGHKGSPFSVMIEKFRELDGTYNSNLFDKHAFETWEEYDGATERVIDILYGKNGYIEYDFSLIPADVLGAVYENYLGYKLQQSETKITLFGTELELSKDSRKRKEQGIYYTPGFIVDYTVKNALGPVLDRCKSVRDLQKIKVLDPACGSGSFLIRAMQLIAEKYQEFGMKDVTVFTRMQILTQNIYGVDLDEQAVEIARLNLLLNTFDAKIKLPDLGNNIKNGNSLISGTDAELKKYFGKNYRDKKPFNWEEEFPEVFKQGGFDCVIGNPPYISAIQDSKGDLTVRKFYRDKFFLKGAFDIYAAFLIRGVQISNKNASYGWIVPNKLMATEYAKDVRKILLENGLHTVIDVSELKVFGHVGIYPVIILGDKTRDDFKEYEVESVDNLYRGALSHSKHTSQYKIFKDMGIRVGSGATGFQAQLLVKHLSESHDTGSIPFVVSGSIDPYMIHLNGVRYMGHNYQQAYIKMGEGIAEKKWNFWNNSKIVISGMTKRLEAQYSEGPLALGVGVYAIFEYGGFDPYFLLAILNSKFITYYLRIKFKHKHLAGGYLAINKSTLEQMPIVKPDGQHEKKLARLAKSRSSLTDDLRKSVENSNEWQKLETEIERTDKKIDEEVYKLYGLSEEETKIVEGS